LFALLLALFRIAGLFFIGVPVQVITVVLRLNSKSSVLFCANVLKAL